MRHGDGAAEAEGGDAVDVAGLYYDIVYDSIVYYSMVQYSISQYTISYHSMLYHIIVCDTM